ncbi:BAG family molecular chaperone regulator 6-like [Hibiscus syriacus]|uniref:BAG family molecular chaperone regulator 6-like n=1 Tax=Hibiscus syriacus TaxID=106335 RepID=UPI001920565E|nr:BAG family molecular chaperone regulator 6-like [Hibiscus syriacus]
MEQKVVNDDNKFESVFKQEDAHSATDEEKEPVEIHSATEENNDYLPQHEDDSGVIPADHVASSESEAGSEATQEKEVLFEETKAAEQPVRTEGKEGEDAPSESNGDHDLAKDTEDEKLIEENKKLKEVMEKLMEAGRDQLSAMSNLTERVKELEEKLARTKKSSKAGNRKVRYAPSYKKLVKVGLLKLQSELPTRWLSEVIIVRLMLCVVYFDEIKSIIWLLFSCSLV